jgi:hypothetical protein
MPRGIVLACVTGLLTAAAPAVAQQAFVPSTRVQNDLRLTETQASLDQGPSPDELMWMGIGLDALLNLSSYAAVLAITGGVATLRITGLNGASTGLAFLDVAMILAQPMAQAYLVYEIGRMNPRAAPQLGWTILGAYAGTAVAASVFGLIYLAIPGGTALAVLGGVVFTVIPAVTTVLVQNATTEERPRGYLQQPMSTAIRF